MKTVYIIKIKQDIGWLGETIGNDFYVYSYRARYEYPILCQKRTDAKTFSTRRAAENAGQKLMEIYPHAYKGYEVIETKRKI